MKSYSNRIVSFDYLKVFALLYIIFGWHMDDYASDMLATRLGRALVIGALGVFVYISGFTLTRSCGEISSFAEVRQYIKKRIVRIYPLYCFALLLSLITLEITAQQFVAGIFLLNAIVNIQVKTFWFVTTLFIFYLLLPYILYNYSHIRTLIISACFLLIATVLNVRFNMIDIRLVYYLPVFIWGVISAKDETVYSFVKSNAMVIFSLLALLVTTFCLDPKQGSLMRYFYISGCLVFSVSPLITFSEQIAPKTTHQFITKLSYASFGMYLFHRFIFYLLLTIYTPESDLGIVLYLFAVGFPLIYLFSERIQTFYDFLITKRFPVSEPVLPGS